MGVYIKRGNCWRVDGASDDDNTNEFDSTTLSISSTEPVTPIQSQVYVSIIMVMGDKIDD